MAWLNDAFVSKSQQPCLLAVTRMRCSAWNLRCACKSTNIDICTSHCQGLSNAIRARYLNASSSNTSKKCQLFFFFKYILMWSSSLDECLRVCCHCCHHCSCKVMQRYTNPPQPPEGEQKGLSAQQFGSQVGLQVMLSFMSQQLQVVTEPNSRPGIIIAFWKQKPQKTYLAVQTVGVKRLI